MKMEKIATVVGARPRKHGRQYGRIEKGRIVREEFLVRGLDVRCLSGL